MVQMQLADTIIVPCAAVGILFAGVNYAVIKKVQVEEVSLASKDSLSAKASSVTKAAVAYTRVMQGASTFIREEYKIAAIFCVFFAGLIYGLVTWGSNSTQGGATAGAFLVGATTSMLCGYLGMMIATFSNVRTTLCAVNDDESAAYTNAFNIAFRGGGVMGYLLCSIGVFILWGLLTVYKNFIFGDKVEDLETLMDCVAGYGLGGSTVAMFGRVGGGIYTKAADVGADLVGKVVAGLEEDDPRNPATIADNVGDNVGDIAGMGADLFGSFAESTCASLVIAASVVKGADGVSLGEAGWNALMFPVTISAAGIIACMLCSFVATDISPVKSNTDIEKVLKVQMTLTAIVMLPVTYFLADQLLPSTFVLESVQTSNAGGYLTATPTKAFICVACGTIGGLIIGLITEYYTSHTYEPVRELATACKSGAAVNVIFGMALGYKSCIIPVFVLAANIYVAFSLCDLYGIALAALGMLSTLATGLTIDGFGPISDNAGGIAEMAEFPPNIRERTDALDAAGNTTAAIGKGFAIGSAALVSLALYGAFVVRLKGLLADSPVSLAGVNIMEPTTFAALLIGAMIPYWFAALTMRSVGKAAGEMVEEVKTQFSKTDLAGKTILEGGNFDHLSADETVPNYDRCIAISTKSSLVEMVAPGALVIGSPLLMGTLFGVQAVFGLLTGSLVSSVQLAVSMSNSGGAWDNCKKYIKGGFSDDKDLKFVKGLKDAQGNPIKPTQTASEAHDAAVQGDTVGDPFKDTSGPALNIVMKLQAIVSLVFAAYFANCRQGQGFVQLDALFASGNNTA